MNLDPHPRRDQYQPERFDDDDDDISSYTQMGSDVPQPDPIQQTPRLPMVSSDQWCYTGPDGDINPAASMCVAFGSVSLPPQSHRLTFVEANGTEERTAGLKETDWGDAGDSSGGHPWQSGPRHIVIVEGDTEERYIEEGSMEGRAMEERDHTQQAYRSNYPGFEGDLGYSYVFVTSYPPQIHDDDIHSLDCAVIDDREERDWVRVVGPFE